MNVHSSADDILAVLLAMDHVDEFELLADAFDNVDDNVRTKLVDKIKEEFELFTIDEAKEAISDASP